MRFFRLRLLVPFFFLPFLFLVFFCLRLFPPFVAGGAADVVVFVAGGAADVFVVAVFVVFAAAGAAFVAVFVVAAFVADVADEVDEAEGEPKMILGDHLVTICITSYRCNLTRNRQTSQCIE